MNATTRTGAIVTRWLQNLLHSRTSNLIGRKVPPIVHEMSSFTAEALDQVRVHTRAAERPLTLHDRHGLAFAERYPEYRDHDPDYGHQHFHNSPQYLRCFYPGIRAGEPLATVELGMLFCRCLVLRDYVPNPSIAYSGRILALRSSV